MSRQCLQRSEVIYLTPQRFTVSTYIGDGLQSEDFQTFTLEIGKVTKCKKPTPKNIRHILKGK